MYYIHIETRNICHSNVRINQKQHINLSNSKPIWMSEWFGLVIIIHNVNVFYTIVSPIEHGAVPRAYSTTMTEALVVVYFKHI